MTAPFRGDGRPCLIGSLPFLDHAEAARTVCEFTPEVPGWVQLTRLAGEGMIGQFAAGLPGLRNPSGKLCVDTAAEDYDAELLAFYDDYLAVQQEAGGIEGSRFALAAEAVPGLFALLEHTPALVPRPSALKGQITGPFTLGTGLRDQNGRALFFDPQLRDVVTKLIAVRARWQARRMAATGLPVLLFIDEPALAGFGSSEYISVQPGDITGSLQEIAAAVHEEGGLAGVHVCANTDWAVVLGAGVDIVSFDAYAYFDRFILYRKAIADFLEAGGILAWGIVPTLSPEDLAQATADALTARLENFIRQASALGFTPSRLLAQSLVTPACGMGALSIELARRALWLTRKVSERLRAMEWKDR